MTSREIIEKFDFLSFTPATIDDNALTVLEARYLKKDEFGNAIEEPNDMFMRVAEAVGAAEKLYCNDETFITNTEVLFYRMMASLDFLPNSPTLMNAGRELGMLSACFLLELEDSMDSIFQCVKDAAMIQKCGGGVGYVFSNLRPKNSIVKTTMGKSSGPVSFMSVFDAMTDTVKQGGTRRGANMGMLSCDHPDIEEFITCKSDNKSFSNFNISVAATDEFMKSATDSNNHVFDMICEQAWKTGDPGLFFIDKANADNPIPSDPYKGTNPCWTGDTKIWTVYGAKRFDELVGNNIPVLTQDNGRFVFKLMRDIRKTGHEEIVEVELNNFTTIRCTKNHNIYLEDGTKKKACELKRNDSIASCYKYKANSKGYYKITNGFEDPLYHHVVVSYKNGRRPDYPLEYVHYIDNNKQNNTPENLCIINAKEHNESNMTGELNPVHDTYGNKNVMANIDFTEEKNPNYRHDINTHEIIESREFGHIVKEMANTAGCGEYTINRRLKDANHCVLSVKFTGECEDVYNGTVDDTHSYFVMCGENDAILSANCGEQILTNYESCNLGSINLSNMMSDGNIDWNKLKYTTTLAVRFLDNVIDVNKYPLPEIEHKTKQTRKIGLGIMGFADACIKHGIVYGSKDSILLAESIMNFIDTVANNESIELGKERGSFPEFKNSIYYTHGYSALRNATRTTIAPTGTLSIIANCSSGIEPIFAKEYTRRTLDDKIFTVKHPLLESGYDEKLFIEAHDIPYDQHICVQAAFQKYTDNAVSKTINMNNNATVEDVRNAYLLAWESGCKGITIFRDGCKGEQVLEHKSNYSENDDDIVMVDESHIIPTSTIHPRKRPEYSYGVTEKIKTGCGNIYVTINKDENGLCETFCNMGKSGACTLSQVEAISRLVSLGLRCGVDPNDIVKQLKGIRCPNPTWNDGKQVLSCADAISTVLNKHINDNGCKHDDSNKCNCGDDSAGCICNTGCDDSDSGNIQMVGTCPDCGGVLMHGEGCIVCRACGYSKC